MLKKMNSTKKLASARTKRLKIYKEKRYRNSKYI